MIEKVLGFSCKKLRFVQNEENLEIYWRTARHSTVKDKKECTFDGRHFDGYKTWPSMPLLAKHAYDNGAKQGSVYEQIVELDQMKLEKLFQKFLKTIPAHITAADS